MSKFAIILLVAAFTACITADDNPAGDVANKIMDSGRNMWDGVMKPMDQFMDMGETAIKNLQAIPNGMSSGTFTSSEHHTSTKNGKVESDGGSSKKITNNNGSVDETSTTE